MAEEPTSSLDEDKTVNVISMLQLAREEFGTTAVLAMHVTDLSMHAARKVLVQD